MIQPLHQQLMATFETTGPDMGKVVFTFPPVPQGSIWTGAITVSSPQGSDPQGLVWTLFRNGTPFLSGHEWPCFGDVQAVGREVMQLIGVYIGANSVPTYAMTASWTGYSADAGEAASLSPIISGSTRGLVQVYNTQGPGGALEVIDYPLPSSVLTDFTPLSGVVGDSGPVLGTITAANFYELWELTVQISAAQLAAVAGVQTITVDVAESGGGDALFHADVFTTPGAAITETIRQRFYGLNMAAGAHLTATLAATGASACSVVVHAIAHERAV